MTHTWRSWGNTGGFVLITFVGIVLTLSMMTVTASPIVITLLALVAAALLVAVWRIARMTVQAGRDGILVRGFWRRRRFEWREIDNIQLEVVDEKLFVNIYAPVLHLVGKTEWEPLRQLSTYSTVGRAPRSKAGRVTAELRKLHEQFRLPGPST
ncbi:hypothetical protein ACFO1B_15985 [Dactylosporangium siamense]|uniref:PH domain-containing protein n=1 Tax=Dactylosporangium siamense TaxID=685454 RepID=A0A919U7A7_9ACTN|nr:hypothetical protein [Dactylosporangium siamense]GIG45339.1 hypothetical protein Dsi01nite_033800 [Dactylosporangium siamense]